MQNNEEKQPHSTYDHIIKYTGLFGGVQGVNLLASVVRNKLVSVILGPSGLGLISLYNTAATLLGNTTNLGIPFSAVRHISELYEQDDHEALHRFIRIVRNWSLLTALLGVLACCICSPWLSLSYFDTTDNWLHFVWISPIVGMAALTGGELAILKGTRRLKQVAMQSLLNSLLAIVLTVPLYYLWGNRAIICSLVLIALSTLLTTLYYSIRCFPFFSLPEKNFSLTGGEKMVRLGVAFTLAGILGSGVEFVIRAYMMQHGSEADVGLYNAGYMVTVTYASMVFVAMETDFFPRLSAVNHDIRLSNEVVNSQIEASVLLIAPLLVIFQIGLPLILPLLYSSAFLPVTSMAQHAVFSMYMRAVALPIAYMSLAKGRSGLYLFAEALYDVMVVALIIWGYTADGLRGTGIALTAASVFDLLVVWAISHRCYGFRLRGKAMRMLLMQLPFGVTAFLVAIHTTGWMYWTCGAVLALCSGLISIRILHKETTLLHTLSEKIKKRFTRQ